jgi:ParB family chromosome partitioning protein
MIKKRGLGRRLEELLAGSHKNISSPESMTEKFVTPIGGTESASINQGNLRQFPIDKIQPGRYQPRKIFQEGALQELAESIRSQGIIQPVVIRPIGNQQYELIAGERRWRAAQLAGLHEIPAIVKEIPDEAAIAMSLIENIQREDLNVMEEAEGLQRLIDEFEMSHLEVAEAIGRSRAAVTNLLRLLKLSPDVKTLVENGDIDAGHAKVLLALEGSEQSQAAKTIVEKGLSVRDAEELVRKMQLPVEKKTAELPDPNIRNLEMQLSDTLGAKVLIQQMGKKKGKLTIFYNNLDELEGILTHIR